MSRRGVFTLDDVKIMGDVVELDRYKDLELTFICDECGKHFKGNKIELHPFGKNFDMFNPMMSLKLVDATDKVIIGTSNTHLLNKDHEYYTLCCPICHATHLWGMTPIDPRKVFGVE